MTNTTRSLKTGDLVTIGGRTAVVESVSADGLRFTDTRGTRHLTADAELLPVAGKPWHRMTAAEIDANRERLARSAVARARAAG